MSEPKTAEEQADRGVRYDHDTQEIWVRLDLYEKVQRERDQYKLAAEMNKQTIENMMGSSR